MAKFLIFCFLSLAFTPESQEKSKKKILFFGDSLTAGYGVLKEKRFTNIIQDSIQQKKLNYKVINAGLSGETSAGGLRRINWLLKEKIDVFVLELGGNDGLRGISVKSTKSNLQKIIDIVRRKNPQVKILLAGMQSPTNMGEHFTEAFKEIFPQLAKENKLSLIPFLLEGVGGISELNLADGVHPNEKGHTIVAKSLWAYLNEIL